MEEKAKPNRKLLEKSFSLAENARNIWFVEPEPGTTLPEMLNPEYWANVARKLSRNDVIQVSSQDGSWMADLVVLAVGPFTAKVHVKWAETFERARSSALAVEVPAGYEIKHRGKNGWCVIRLSDNKVLRENEATQAAAAGWLDAHLKTFA